MLLKANSDLRKLLEKKDIRISGHSSEVDDPEEDRLETENGRPDSKSDNHEAVQEAPPKHLPRPTRR